MAVFAGLTDLFTAAGAWWLNLRQFTVSVLICPTVLILCGWDPEYPLQFGLMAVCWSYICLFRLFLLWQRKGPETEPLVAMEF